MKKAQGITLIALVVTIVTMLILAAVSINISFGENGIFRQASSGTLQYRTEEVKENITFEMSGLVAEAAVTKNPLTAEKIVDHFEGLDWVGSATKESEDTVRIISTDRIIVDIKFTPFNGFEMIEQGLDDGEPYPTITIEQIPMEGIAGETIKIKVTASVQTTGETTGITTVENVTTGESKEYTEGGVIFEVTTNGEYTFKATTNKGKTKTGKININVVDGGVIEISIDPTTPRNTTKVGTQNGVATGPIKVTINYGEIELTNSDRYQYRIGTEGSWQTASSNQITVDVTANTIVVARYYDGLNSIGVQSYNIQNVDNVAPTNVTGTATSTTTTITVTASANDTASENAGSDIAGILRYQYRVSGGTWQTENTLTDLTHSTNYTVEIKAIDKAGNETIGSIMQATDVNNRVPTDLTVAYSTKSTNSITVNAQANDADGNQLTYTLYTATSENGSYTQKATRTVAANTQVSLQATGLSMYTRYYYYVTVSDGIASAVSSSKSNVRTYCSGRINSCTRYSCPGGSTTSSNCNMCNGSGICPGTYTYWGTKLVHNYTGELDYCDVCGKAPATCSPASMLVCRGCNYSGRVVWRGNEYCSLSCLREKFPTNSWTEPNDPGKHSGSMTCTNCGGDGLTTSVTTCSHGYTASHYYCNRNSTNCSSRHYWCSHGYSSQHD